MVSFRCWGLAPSQYCEDHFAYLIVVVPRVLLRAKGTSQCGVSPREYSGINGERKGRTAAQEARSGPPCPRGPRGQHGTAKRGKARLEAAREGMHEWAPRSPRPQASLGR